MAKYSKKLADQICSLIKKDCYSIAEICSLSGITRETYYAWLKAHPDFSDAIARAREDYDQLVVKEAKNSLMNKIRGYTVQETRTVMVDAGKPGPDGKPLPKIRERIVIEKHVQPDIQAIIFVLTNKAPEEYKIRQSTEVTGKDGKDLIPARILTQKEAREFLEKLDREM